MFCSKCGSSNEDLNKWCTTCGYKFEDNQEDTGCTLVDGEAGEILKEYTAEEPEALFPEPEPQKIKHYMGWSIIAALFGSIIFGIAAVIFSGITKAELAADNIDKAKIYSDHTKFFCLIALSVAIVKLVFIVATLIMFISLSGMPLLF